MKVKVESAPKPISCPFLSQVTELTGHPVDVQTKLVALLNDKSLMIMEGPGGREALYRLE